MTIILTSYNKPKLLEQSIQSVLNQTISNWELWIMDDHSNKETHHLITRFLNDNRVTYINSKVKDQDRYKKTRYAALINQALSLSTGKYITYLTDDTTYLPDRLQKMTDYFNLNPSHNIVYGGQLLRFLDGDSNVFFESKTEAKIPLTMASNKVDHCSVMHTRKIAEDVYAKYGSYWNDDPIFWHNADAEFWKRLNEIEAFQPIDDIFEIALKTPTSFQVLNRHVPDPLPNDILVSGLSNDIYLINNQRKRLISKESFDYFKYLSSKIVQIPDPLLYKYQTGKAVTQNQLPNQLLIKQKGEEKFYLIQENKKREFINSQTLTFFSFNRLQAVEFSIETIDAITTGAPITSEINQNNYLPDGKLFSYNEELFLSQKNRLHLIDVNVALKLKYNIREAITIEEKEFQCFQQGDSFTWGFTTY